ncbi:MAG: cytochrome c-type biogenesis protein [Solirubrobacterales bacterium]
MAPRRVALAALLVAGLLVPASGALAQSRASLPDIEDEVMCPICGTLLELSEAPQADRQRVFIRGLIAEGRSKEQIKDALVAEYGEEVLATPQGSGFDLSAYLVPIAAALAAAAALAFGVRRWRRASRQSPGPEPATPRGEDAERLESDLARYDL